MTNVFYMSETEEDLIEMRLAAWALLCMRIAGPVPKKFDESEGEEYV